MNLQSQPDNSHKSFVSNGNNPNANPPPHQHYHHHHHRQYRQTRPLNTYHIDKPIPPIENDLKSTDPISLSSGSTLEKDWSKLPSQSRISSRILYYLRVFLMVCVFALIFLYQFVCSLMNHTNKRRKERKKERKISQQTFVICSMKIYEDLLVKQTITCFQRLNTFINIDKRERKERRTTIWFLYCCQTIFSFFLSHYWLMSISDTVLT